MLILPSTLTSQEARDTQRMLTQAMQQAVSQSGDQAELTIDASALQRFDSAALAVLLECQRLAHVHGKGLAVRQAPAKLGELARLYGVGELLNLPSESAA